MKVKSLFLMALAASMTLVSCDKSEDLGQNTDTQLKSVTVTLPNIQKAPAANVGTRAMGDAVADGSKVALKNYKVFFLSGNTEVSVPQFEGAAQKVYFDATADGADWATNMGKYTYHFLPAAVNKVAVVGNIATADMTWEQVQKLTAVDVLNDGTTGGTNDANGHPYYQLYGESALTRTGILDDKDHNNVYTASVNLAPRTSRFEIYGFEYTLEEGNDTYTFQSVELNKIALSNYATKFDFMTMAAVGTRVVAPTEATAIWDWIANADANWSNSLNSLSLAQDAKKFVNGTDIPENYTQNGEGATGIITYGLTHATNVGENPELLLSFYGVGADGSKTPLYLRGKFTKQVFEANGVKGNATTGKIYRVFFPILDNVWEQPERCIELTVTVAEWEVVPVTPEF